MNFRPALTIRLSPLISTAVNDGPAFCQHVSVFISTLFHTIGYGEVKRKGEAKGRNKRQKGKE